MQKKNTVYQFETAPVVQNNLKSDKTYNVAILVPVSHPALEEIQQGFIQTLLEKVNISYDIFNGNGDRLLMRSQAEHAMQKGYDLICALTTPISLICKEVSSQRKSNIPVVCCAVSENPIEIGLVKSLQSSENNFVVMCDHYDFEKQLKVLLTLHSTKKLILPYYPDSALEKQAKQLQEICKKLGIELLTTKIYTTNELFAKVDALLSFDDEVIIVLKDNLVVSGIESLVTLARRKHKTLYASDLNSADKGAVLAFGVQEYDIGVTGARSAISILRDQKQPSEIPSIYVNDFKVKVNLKELNAQNFKIDETLLFLMKSTLFEKGK